MLVMGYHAANFGLPRPFRARVRPGTRQTDRETDTAAHFINVSFPTGADAYRIITRHLIRSSIPILF